MNAVNGYAGPAGVDALPVITVTRGRATDAELAAVTAVLFAVRSAAALAADAAAAAFAGRPGSSPLGGIGPAAAGNAAASRPPCLACLRPAPLTP